MSEAKPPHRWRENVEALTMAIAVALLFKYFVLEISKIPSGSMQPTLMGSPEAGVFDRTLVDKLSFRFRDPRRFEIVVFKHPLEQSRIMVKRLVGMPGEELKIEYGDLWRRATEHDAWEHVRRPEAVQRAMWRELRRDPRSTDWSVVRGGKEWRVDGDAITARSDGAARFPGGSSPITDQYLDGYPRALVDDIPPRANVGHSPVGDVRLSGDVVALAGTTAVRIELTEGQRVYEFTLPGPAAPADATTSVRIKDSTGSGERVEQGERFRLTAGARVAFSAQNLDDRLALALEGRTVLDAEIDPSAQQECFVTVSIDGEGADLSDLSVARDIYYQGPDGHGAWSTVIPPGNYVMLGDNTHDSADSRLWVAETFSFPEEGAATTLRGNYREGENPLTGPLSDGRPAWRLKDEWGEVHWFAKAGLPSPKTAKEPLVARELILGRALAIFWPIQPFDGLWRIGWLR